MDGFVGGKREDITRAGESYCPTRRLSSFESCMAVTKHCAFLFVSGSWLSIDQNGVISRYKYRDLFDLMRSCRLVRQVCVELWIKRIESNGSGYEYLWMKREKILHVLDGLIAQIR